VKFSPTDYPGYLPARTRPSKDASMPSAPDTASARLYVFSLGGQGQGQGLEASLSKKRAREEIAGPPSRKKHKHTPFQSPSLGRPREPQGSPVKVGQGPCDVCGIGAFASPAKRNAHLNSAKHARQVKLRRQDDHRLLQRLQGGKEGKGKK
jgi:hypothetical protein